MSRNEKLESTRQTLQNLARPVYNADNRPDYAPQSIEHGPMHVASPDEASRRMEHEIKIENIRADNMLSSCLSDRATDRRLLEMIFKFTISLFILAISFYGILNSSGDRSFWISLVSFVIGHNAASRTPMTKPKA